MENVCKIVRKYAEFAAALASVNASWPDERLSHMLQQLQVEFVGY